MTYPHDPQAPWNDSGERLNETCEACNKRLSDVEQADPMVIDKRTFCDECASDVMQLKFDGYIADVNHRTKALRYKTDIFETLAQILKPE